MALLLASVFLLVCVDCCSSPVRPGVGVNILNEPSNTRGRASQYKTPPIYPLQGHTGRAGPPHSRTTEVLWGLIQCTSASMLHGAHTSRPAHTVSTFFALRWCTLTQSAISHAFNINRQQSAFTQLFSNAVFFFDAHLRKHFLHDLARTAICRYRLVASKLSQWRRSISGHPSQQCEHLSSL
jgi:hypothetical protein